MRDAPGATAPLDGTMLDGETNTGRFPSVASVNAGVWCRLRSMLLSPFTPSEYVPPSRSCHPSMLSPLTCRLPRQLSGARKVESNTSTVGRSVENSIGAAPSRHVEGMALSSTPYERQLGIGVASPTHTSWRMVFGSPVASTSAAMRSGGTTPRNAPKPPETLIGGRSITSDMVASGVHENPMRGLTPTSRGMRSVCTPNTASTSGLYAGTVPERATSSRAPPSSWNEFDGRHSSPSQSAPLTPLVDRVRDDRMREYDDGRFAARSSSDWKVNMPNGFATSRDEVHAYATSCPNLSRCWLSDVSHDSSLLVSHVVASLSDEPDVPPPKESDVNPSLPSAYCTPTRTLPFGSAMYGSDEDADR